MDKNNLIGITLIFILFFVWAQYNAPSEAQIAEQQRVQDSIQLVQHQQDSLASLSQNPANATALNNAAEPDSVKQARLKAQYGAFAEGLSGTEQISTLKNDLFTINFTNKGGRIKEVILNEYHKVEVDENGEEKKITLKLLEDEKNKFEFQIPISAGQQLSSSDLYFQPQLNGNTLTFRVNVGDGKFVEQKYTIQEGKYNIDYDIQLQGLNQSTQEIELTWVNYLDKLERNTAYERNYSTVYFKGIEDSPDYCSCTGDEKEEAEEKLKWVSHSNQFFNSSLIAKEYFNSASLETNIFPVEGKDLKKLTSKIRMPYQNGQPIALQMYVGPNEFDRLSNYNAELEDLIPYGTSIFGTINRWIIRPLFNFLSKFFSSAGIVILVLTLIVKMLLYPLTYKMLYSQSKMGALKPRIEALKAKMGDDQQAQQMETMKLYREFGVSPLGGCFPIALQMPIWFALYRFFPASIEFRQAPFLWATDLSSYDVFAYLPFEIPFYGMHVSMFTLLWAVTTVIYTYYNTKHMDMSVNPMMKYMQYFMPIMFLFFFNNFASGLSCYLFFQNVINIGQTIVTKNYLINQDKIKKELEDYKKKPKKKGGFQERLAKALEEQQNIQKKKEDMDRTARKKKKK